MISETLLWKLWQKFSCPRNTEYSHGTTSILDCMQKIYKMLNVINRSRRNAHLERETAANRDTLRRKANLYASLSNIDGSRTPVEAEMVLTESYSTPTCPGPPAKKLKIGAKVGIWHTWLETQYYQSNTKSIDTHKEVQIYDSILLVWSLPVHSDAIV